MLRRQPDRVVIHKRLFKAYENELDANCEIDWLRQPRIASMIRQNLYHHDGEKYVLHAYCIMPNHVHVLLTPRLDQAKEHDTTTVGESADSSSPLSAIMHSLKSYTANQANKLLGRSGRFWQPESYDHWVRDDDELERIVNYIRANPVKAKLVCRHEDWFWCSCHDRFLSDGTSCGWLMKS
jgi:putative DNA methylase